MKELKDMTQEQAQAEARRRWGASGIVRFRPPGRSRSQRGRLARYCCTVSNGRPGAYRSVEGQGNTWREAFADAAASRE